MLYRRIFIAALLLIFTTLSLNSQVLHGIVKDDEGKGVEAATIIVQNQDSIISSVCITDSCGAFSFENAPFPYILIVSHVAYSTHITRDSVNDVTVMLGAPIHTLDEVTIRGNLPMRVNESGALQYNGRMLAENHPVTNALDMLSEIPTIQRTGDSYSIIGTTSFNILVNGKKSGMSAEQIQSYLASIPAERVSNIDVYYNTPSRFGIRGASVNIVLSNPRSSSTEMRGSISGGIQQSAKTRGTAGVDVGFSSEKWSANIGYSGIYGDKESDLKLETEHNCMGTTHDVFHDNRNYVKSFNNNFYTDADITLSKESSLQLSYILQNKRPKTNSSALIAIDDAQTNSDVYSKNISWLHNLKASYCHKKLEVGVDAIFYNQNESQSLADSYSNDLTGDYKQNSSKIELFVDNSFSFMKGNVNYGLKGDYSSTTSDKHFESERGYSDESFRFKQNEISGTAYLGYKHSLGKKGFASFNIEGIYFHSDYSKDGSSNINLWNEWQFNPSVTIVYRPHTRGILQFSLNSERFYPSYWTTAANRTYISTYCVTEGNTELKTYTKYSSNLNYILKSKYIFGFFGESSPKHFIQSMILSDKELIASYRYFNLKHDYRFGIMTVVPIDWTKNFHSRVTAMAFDMHQNGNISEDLSFDKNKTTAMIRLSNNLSLINNKLNIELSGWYQSPAIQGSYDIQEMYSISFGMTWITPLSGLSMNIKGEDIFDTYRMKTKCKIGSMKYSFCNDIDMQCFSLTIRYNFNGYKNQERKSVDASRYGL